MATCLSGPVPARLVADEHAGRPRLEALADLAGCGEELAQSGKPARRLQCYQVVFLLTGRGGGGEGGRGEGGRGEGGRGEGGLPVEAVDFLRSIVLQWRWLR